jgi:type III secretory pathway component EscV
MSMMHGNHLKHILIGAAVLLGVFVVAGVPLGRALPYALFLACPLMMIAMMFMMGRSQDGHSGCSHEHHDRRSEDAHEVVEAERVDAGSRG